MYYLAAQPAYAAFRARSPGHYGQHQGRRRKIRFETAKTRLPSRLNLHSAPLSPAVSFLGGFQTPAGPNKASAYPCGRHLKPITKAASSGNGSQCLLPGVDRPSKGLSWLLLGALHSFSNEFLFFFSPLTEVAAQ